MDPARPIDALNNARNKKVIIELKNNRQYVGILKAFDIHINCVLENAEERVDGEVKRKMGSIFIRGDTITILTTEWFKWLKEHHHKVRSRVAKTTFIVEGAVSIH